MLMKRIQENVRTRREKKRERPQIKCSDQTWKQTELRIKMMRTAREEL